MKSKTNVFQGRVFLGLFLISLLMQMLINNGEVFFDASLYWELGKECGWSVRNMTSAYRGWLLPFFFSMCYKLGMLLGKEFLGYWILSSIVLLYWQVGDVELFSGFSFADCLLIHCLTSLHFSFLLHRLFSCTLFWKNRQDGI